MYLRRFGLNQPPFHITPDPDFLFLSPSHREAIASILYGVSQRKGFVLITGEVGVGKTTVLRSYLQNADARKFRFIYLFDTRISFKNLVTAIHRGLDLPTCSGDLFEMVPTLHEALLEENRRGRTVALLVDEAQNMPVEALENLTVLSNLETNTEKLLQIVLCGQPELEKKLDTPTLRKLKQRIAIRFRILPLKNREGVAYIRHRLIRAGHDMGDLFTGPAMRKIVRAAGGNPRTINILCDNALVSAYGSHRDRVTPRIVKEVLADRSGKAAPESLGWRPAALFLLFLLTGGWYIGRPESGWFQKIPGVLPGNRAGKEALPVSSAPAPSPLEIRPSGVSGTGQETLPSVPPAPEAGSRKAGEREILPEPSEERDEGTVALPGLAGDAGAAAMLKVRRVRPGDTLGTLIRGEYGKSDEDLLQQVLERNPQIRNADRIYAGDNIYFPRPGGGILR